MFPLHGRVVGALESGRRAGGAGLQCAPGAGASSGSKSRHGRSFQRASSTCPPVMLGGLGASARLLRSVTRLLLFGGERLQLAPHLPANRLAHAAAAAISAGKIDHSRSLADTRSEYVRSAHIAPLTKAAGTSFPLRFPFVTPTAACGCDLRQSEHTPVAKFASARPETGDEMGAARELLCVRQHDPDVGSVLPVRIGVQTLPARPSRSGQPRGSTDGMSPEQLAGFHPPRFQHSGQSNHSCYKRLRAARL